MDFIASQIVTEIDQAVVAKADTKHRNHLGASEIGEECCRALWYKFRWVKTIRFNGRMLRLFERGNREEAVFCELLRAAGWTVHEVDPDTGKQYRFSAVYGHFGGSMDAIGYAPAHLQGELGRGPLVLEFKTANKNATGKLMGAGVQREKPRHFYQMHLYGSAIGARLAVYLSVNKDNDELYCEVVLIDRTIADEMIDKATDIIIGSHEPFPRISDDPTFYKCKFCDYHAICHLGAPIEKNCRSCRHAVPGEQAQWVCQKHDAVIPADQIRKEHACWEGIV